ncbi:prepilin-type N-terminal cleavage/methylation domain-containing protein [Halobacteriovorax sp. HLS]|uniref:prepilin-type N-terminal cleavage/methylation domain-containing protein n=1 Tax=Halobacteriovorax sp. HLS TaxID=2234000 RepID=UPI000FDA2AA9|nr:prepilin-type N-terminal cleavage/methylation domain-containing protein [Halobacteriovorax sp. HLS]
MKKVSKNRNLSNQEGFTLIEVLIAITVLALLMSMMYTIVQNSTETKDKIISEDRDSLQLVTALERLETDISQIYSPMYFNAAYSKNENQDQDEPTPTDTTNTKDPLSTYEPSERFPAISTAGDIIPAFLNESKTELVFMSTSNRRIREDSKQSRFNWIRYSIRSISEESLKTGVQYELVRSVESENIFKKDFNWDKIKEHVLLKDLKSFQFQFWNKETKKFVDSIAELAIDRETPRIIKVKMVWINKDNNEIEIERTFRPLFPLFDTEKDEKAKKTETAKDPDSNPSNGGNLGSNVKDSDDEQE